MENVRAVENAYKYLEWNTFGYNIFDFCTAPRFINRILFAVFTFFFSRPKKRFSVYAALLSQKAVTTQAVQFEQLLFQIKIIALLVLDKKIQ